MQRQRQNKWSSTAGLVREARQPCDGLSYFIAANFGSRCLGQASKKGSSGSGLLSRQLCARSIRNTWLACVQQLRRRLRTARAGPRKYSGQRGVPAAV